MSETKMMDSAVVAEMLALVDRTDGTGGGLPNVAAGLRGYINGLRSHIAALEAQLTTAQHEVAQMDAALRVWIPECEARISSTCVFCEEATPSGLRLEELRLYVALHAQVCSKHPMRALEADNAALLEQVMALLVVLWGPDFERRPAEIAAQRVVADPRPGAALLAEHAKALRRARNEGLEKAAQEVSETKSMAPTESLAFALLDGAQSRIRARKEPEE